MTEGTGGAAGDCAVKAARRRRGQGQTGPERDVSAVVRAGLADCGSADRTDPAGAEGSRCPSPARSHPIREGRPASASCRCAARGCG